jgi:16S rRNA (guanine(966)-N(2))-methyltransferase RsmD
MMRVAAGAVKGHKLRSSRGMLLRPTSMKVKEALFNILGERIKGALFVDFFAGTGNIGIEALSRGADHVVFVENHLPSIKLLKDNLNTCGFKQKATISVTDAITFLKKAKRWSRKFDILFADPPYHGPLAERFLRHLSKSDMISKNAYVVIEHFHKVPLPDKADDLQLIRRYHYGDTLLSIYQHESKDEAGDF